MLDRGEGNNNMKIVVAGTGYVGLVTGQYYSENRYIDAGLLGRCAVYGRKIILEFIFSYQEK